MLTITELSGTYATAIAANEEQRALLQRKVRNLVVRRLLNPSDYRGGRRDALFDTREIAKAIVMLALIDLGLDTTTLLAAEHLWSFASDRRLPNLPATIAGNNPPLSIDAMIHDLDVQGSPDWSFVMIIRVNAKTGERAIVGGFERADQQPASEGDPRERWTRRTYAEGEYLTLGVLEVPATVLVRRALKGAK